MTIKDPHSGISQFSDTIYRYAYRYHPNHPWFGSIGYSTIIKHSDNSVTLYGTPAYQPTVFERISHEIGHIDSIIMPSITNIYAKKWELQHPEIKFITPQSIESSMEYRGITIIRMVIDNKPSKHDDLVIDLNNSKVLCIFNLYDGVEENKMSLFTHRIYKLYYLLAMKSQQKKPGVYRYLQNFNRYRKDKKWIQTCLSIDFEHVFSALGPEKSIKNFRDLLTQALESNQ